MWRIVTKSLSSKATGAELDGIVRKSFSSKTTQVGLVAGVRSQWGPQGRAAGSIGNVSRCSSSCQGGDRGGRVTEKSGEKGMTYHQVQVSHHHEQFGFVGPAVVALDDASRRKHRPPKEHEAVLVAGA